LIDYAQLPSTQPPNNEPCYNRTNFHTTLHRSPAIEYPTHSAAHHASKFTHRERNIALIIVAFAFVMDLLDNTIVNIAIPSIQHNLGASYSAIQWLVAGYSLAFAVLLITGGRLGDVVGYKKLFLLGVTGFTLASLLSGVAWDITILIGARLVQGAFAALMVPQVMSLMQIMYKPNERGQIMGMFGALAGVAASLGPVVGGLLIQGNLFGLDWRPIFLINVPVGIFAILAGLRYLPDGKSPHPLKLDIVGTLIVVIALFSLVYPLIQGRDLGWPAWTFWLMALSIPLFVIFGIWQNTKNARDGSPLVVPALFKTRTFITGLIVNLIFEGAMLGFFFPFTLLLQVGLGYSVIIAALTGIPTAIGISVTMAVLSQKIIPKLGRYTMTLGTVIMAIGLTTIYLFIRQNGLATTGWEFIPGLLLVGIGMALIMSPMFSIVLADVDPKQAGSASGVLNAVQQLGGAIGVALIGVVLFGQLTAHAPASFDSVEPSIRSQLAAAQVPTQAQDAIIASVRSCFVDRNTETDTSKTPTSCKNLTAGPQTPTSANIGSIVATATKQANTNNFVHAFKAAVIYEAVILAAVFLLSFMLPRRIKFDENGLY
jgi:EmrB/QacA subfamily drug resistance transporter